jgi:glycosyltransferase involved in cell wall biosynthesis
MNWDGSTVTLVIPCYNEAHRLRLEDFRSALDCMPWLSLLFVDDGSTDQTAAMLAPFCERHGDRSAIIALRANSGKGEAVRVGLQEALARSPLVGYWDADLAAPLQEVGPLRATLLERSDIDWAWGIRLRSLGRDVQRKPLRHVLGRLFATVTSVLLRIPVYDSQCGAKLFRSNPVLVYALSSRFSARWIFDVELLARGMLLAPRSGVQAARILEQPLGRWTHQSGSKLRPIDFVRAVMELVGIVRRCTTATESV